jgi:uncharacterized protein (DUF433 family)
MLILSRNVLPKGREGRWAGARPAPTEEEKARQAQASEVDGWWYLILHYDIAAQLKKGVQAMALERTAHPYIVRDSTIYGGEPIVEGTRTGVRHIILLFQAGKDPEEIADIQRITLAQVYDAISYFYDNEAEIEHYIRNESWGAS